MNFNINIPRLPALNESFDLYKKPLMVNAKMKSENIFKIIDLRTVQPSELKGLVLQEYATKEIFMVNRYFQNSDENGAVVVCVYATTAGNSSNNLYSIIPNSYVSKSHTDFIIPANLSSLGDDEGDFDITPPFAVAKKPKIPHVSL